MGNLPYEKFCGDCLRLSKHPDHVPYCTEVQMPLQLLSVFDLRAIECHGPYRLPREVQAGTTDHASS